jgi:dihydroorotase
MIISNGRWLNPRGELIRSDLHVVDGKIVAMSDSFSSLDDEIVYDARDLLILPGAIDPHVHFREPGQLYKEGIESGSKAALRGGVTTILDMPNNQPPCSTAKRLQHKKELFRRKSLVNWGIMFHTTVHNRDPVQAEIACAKIYMAKSSALPAITEMNDLKNLFIKFPMIAIHAEDETCFDRSPERSPWHHENRPREAITSALRKIEEALKSLARKQRPRIVICHMNTADEVEWIVRMKQEGFDVWAETCPHYLIFTQDDYMKRGSAFQVNPPIRTLRDQKHLREALSGGIIDFIGTDHAPHSQQEKHSSRPPSGIAAIEWLIPQMLHFVDEGLISWKSFHELICSGASRCYSITGRDGLKPGNAADLVFVRKSNDPINPGRVQTKAATHIYKDFNFRWEVVATMVNGVMKYDNNRFFTEMKGMEVCP